MKKEEISINAIKTKTVKIIIESIPGSSLITHRLDPATVEAFTKRETGISKKKEFRDYDKEYQSCFYLTSDKKYGFPASGIMGALLDATVPMDIHKTTIKRAFRLMGDIYELKYKKLNRRVDNPRRSGINKTPDVRHRPEFIDWEMELFVLYDPNQISLDQIINLINQAGFSSGIGDWRPSSPKSSGTHGMFKVKVTK